MRSYDAQMAGLPLLRVGLEGLRCCRLFDAVDDDRLATIARQMRSRRYRAGETIFHQDDPGDALHLIVSGTVKIVLPSAEGDEPAIIATLGAGDFFGALRSEEHTSELQSLRHLVCRLLLEKKKRGGVRLQRVGGCPPRGRSVRGC